jgi:L-fuculose-phosphate aldolase
VKTAKYVTPGDTRLGESLLPYVKDSNTILLQNHGTVTFDVDLEGAYYKLEIVDAYSRILLLAKQIGSIRPLDANEMKELLDLKVRFGLDEPRLKDGGKDFTCQSDFISRVAGDIGKKGRIQLESGTAPAPQVPSGSELRPSTAVQPSGMDQVIHSLLPAGSYSEADIETLVQTITDQIMASA